MRCEKTSIVAASELLIVRCTAEKKDIFYIYSLIINSGVKFVHEVYFNYEFDKLKDYQQSDLIEKILNKDCFKDFIVKVVMLDSNAQKLNVIFLKMMIFLLAGLQSKPGFHN